MKRDVDIIDISDGRFYRENDMVKAACILMFVKMMKII